MSPDTPKTADEALLSLMDKVGSFLLEVLNYHILGIISLSTAALFIGMRIFRFRGTKKDFKHNLVEQVLRAAIAPLVIFTGLQIMAASILSKKHAFERLSEDSLVIMGITATACCLVVGCLECYSVFKHTSPDDAPEAKRKVDEAEAKRKADEAEAKRWC